ncbi:DUF28-domain-containing protein [Punctularia strigosozonata HHB-11173 SS5]|uniref:DUF28-domain-containing protein n=1 Tax=Punctularia strigosozonata (strain HHB-11173) TaxID=741275 RepID=UPI0004417C96|nr:DUF28-domain-containing protein [Punctularia strigosozonata HHB-11173 SS5]EIN07795.1 DUF28-domain-containing protein [Punctularia strigosozonata HHB-11173 SS5]
MFAARVTRLAGLQPGSCWIPPRRCLSATNPALSGHNKWSKIEKKKGAADAQKSAMYAKARSDILIAARMGGSPNPELNQALAVVLKRVKAQGVPKENIERALERAAGTGKKADQQLTYEVLARGAVGLVVECLSDNSNRTFAAVRETLDDHKARFAPVLFQFKRLGSVRVAVDASAPDREVRMEKLIEAALEAGAEDFQELGSSTDSSNSLEMEFTCPPQSLAQLTAAVSIQGICKELLSSALEYRPTEPAPQDPELKATIDELVDDLEANEDVLSVWTTLDR